MIIETEIDYAEFRLTQWGREITGGFQSLDFSDENILKRLQQHKGFAPSSSGVPVISISPATWEMECIVCTIGTYDKEQCALLRAGYCYGYGRWSIERKQMIEAILGKAIRRAYLFDLKDRALTQVCEYLRFISATTYCRSLALVA
jgi:hypothetical protein